MKTGFENVVMLLFKIVGLSSSCKFIYCCFAAAPVAAFVVS